MGFLLNWNGRRMDKYDIRALMEAPVPSQSRPVHQQAEPPPESTEDEDFADLLRFFDIYTADYKSDREKGPSRNAPVFHSEAEGSFCTLATILFPRIPVVAKDLLFNLLHSTARLTSARSSPAGSATSTPSSAQSSVASAPSFTLEFETPTGMKLPEESKTNEIMEKTASFVRNASVQADALSKIRFTQDSNPNFQFLKADNALFPFFEFLLKTSQQRQQAIILAKVVPRIVAPAGSIEDAHIVAPAAATLAAPEKLPDVQTQSNVHRFAEEFMSTFGGDDFIGAVQKFVMNHSRPRTRTRFSFLHASNDAYAYLRYYAYEEHGILISEKDPQQQAQERARLDEEEKKADRRAKAKAFLAMQQGAGVIQKDSRTS